MGELPPSCHFRAIARAACSCVVSEGFGLVKNFSEAKSVSPLDTTGAGAEREARFELASLSIRRGFARGAFAGAGAEGAAGESAADEAGAGGDLAAKFSGATDNGPGGRRPSGGAATLSRGASATAHAMVRMRVFMKILELLRPREVADVDQERVVSKLFSCGLC
jgi:hypothetical protein